MAERASVKAKRAPRRGTMTAGGAHDVAAASGDSPSAGTDRREAIERERDSLISELEAARAQIAQLEQQHVQIVNRIDWIIESLHGLFEDER